MGHKVLLVDDDNEVRELLATALHTRGCTVIQASCLSDARLAMQAGSIDLAVIDGFLPDGSGIAFIQELRDQGQKVRVAFLSALWRDEAILRRLTEELGVVRVLHKPLSVSSFLVQIMSVLEPVERLTVTWTPPSPRKQLRKVRAATASAPPPPPPPPAPAQAAPAAPPPAPASSPHRALTPRSDALRERYLRGLSARVEELEQTLDEAQRPPGSADLMLAACELAERIESSAVGFELHGLAQAASEVVVALRAALEGRMGSASGLFSKLERLGDLARSARSFGASDPSDRERGLYAARLLVVSPDPEVLELARGRGAQLLVDVVTADSAEEALRACAIRSPELALIDLPMNGAGGQLAEVLRGLEGLGRIPVAFLVAESEAVVPPELPGVGAPLLLSRGLEIEELSLVLGRVEAMESKEVPTALIVDDDPNFCRVLAALLSRSGVSVTTVTQADRALSNLAELHPDLLILDALMPRLGGLELCRIIRARPGWDELPVVLLTGVGGRDVVMAGLEAGADDVFLKGGDPGELVARLKARLERSLVLRARSDRDALTSMLNRRAFTEQVSARLEECRRIRRSLSLGVIAMPGLAEIGREHGARRVEELLSAAARLLHEETRSYDVRARWGRAELAVVLPGTERAAAESALSRVCERLMNGPSDGLGRPLEVRVGVAAFPEDGRGLEELVRTAVARQGGEP